MNLDGLLYAFVGVLLAIIGVFLKNVLDDVRTALGVGNRQQTLIELIKQDVDNHKKTVETEIKELKSRLESMGEEMDEMVERLERLEDKRLRQLPAGLHLDL